MTQSQWSGGRSGLVWAVVGGVILVAGVVAIILLGLLPQSDTPATPSPTDSPTSTPAPPANLDAAVDPAVAERGWRPEPITTDAETYIRAALESASTFDTTKGTRDEWLSHLDTWFTPDTRYPEADQAARMKAAQLELRQAVVLPQQEWDSLAAEDGRVVATTNGDVTFVPVAEDSSGGMSIGTADVTLTFTRSDGSGGEGSYDETVRVSVQVLCGAGSVPTPDTAQQAGDCKVVRWFAESLEP
ncbi:hypothetical protein [Microbacterium thalassium]|uniref:Uncharacterized protein n=1 Tax=Microbacterium thalassium TaxID=362649 RepID=A0A7X0KTB9_9MICO|nr:hypothetical protein [Microbacterium thalassium]MBB6389971.1 hypothetical protein [Microbacterium thalassium]GLK24657.1 hypothetical protein GCM10017607_19750 [Microbacterium thalassium]